ncbi:hypothetical protein CFI11_10645 [Thalassococcus sp. S3]|nr:hypothetical protein CFI11_10645 [Thalassococcus sp. S3]
MIALLGTTLLAPFAIADEVMVNEIDVDAALTAPEDANALLYYPDITEDIEREIVKLVPIGESDESVSIQVNLDKISLDGDTMLPDSQEFNTIEGVIAFYRDGRSSPVKSLPMKVTAVTGAAPVGEGFVTIEPSTEDFYGAMVVGFAEAVADQLPEELRDIVRR